MLLVFLLVRRTGLLSPALSSLGGGEGEGSVQNYNAVI